MLVKTFDTNFLKCNSSSGTLNFQTHLIGHKHSILVGTLKALSFKDTADIVLTEGLIEHDF